MSGATSQILAPMIQEWPWLNGRQVDDLNRLAETLEGELLHPSIARLSARAVHYAVQNGQMQTECVYRDTEDRMRRDPAFAAAVQSLESIARKHGFTPGEIKQIAFKAALNIEETRLMNWEGTGR